MSSVHPQKPKLSSSRRPRSRWARRIMDSWPLLVWFGVILIMIWAYRQGIAFNHMNGVVIGAEESIAPTETGRVTEILVKTGDTVASGEVVALLDTTLVDSDIAELERDLAVERDTRVRQLTSDMAGLEEELRTLKRANAGDKAELAAVVVVLGRLESLFKSNLVLEEVVGAQRIEADRLEALVDVYPGQITEVESSLEVAKAALERVREGGGVAGLPDDASDGQQYLELLRQQREQMSLRAVKGGKVFLVERSPGEVAAAGMPVVRIVGEPTEISSFLPQEHLYDVRVGDSVWVSPSYDRHTSYPSTITTISPRILNTPDAASPLPNKMLRGREVVVALPEEVDFLPGQTVIVHLEEPGAIPLVEFLSRLFAPGRPVTITAPSSPLNSQP
ncbi:hypothetical protein BH23VER1_BH23VER1_18680 [soil metagenome]